MVDAEPVDEAFADELEHLRVRLLEDRGILDAHAAELADVEEAAVPARRAIPVEVAARRSRSAQNGFSSSEVAMWFGTMSRMTPRSGRRAPPRRARGTRPRRRARRRCASGRRRRTRASSPSGLQRRREIQVRRAELAHVRHDDLPRPPEPELPRAAAGTCSGTQACPGQRSHVPVSNTRGRSPPNAARFAHVTAPKRTMSRCQTPRRFVTVRYARLKRTSARPSTGHLGAGGDDARRGRRCPLRSRPASARRSGASAA